MPYSKPRSAVRPPGGRTFENDPSVNPPPRADADPRAGTGPGDYRRAGAGDKRGDDLARLAWLLDDLFRIPGTQRRIGLDGLLGLIPGVGDAVTTLISAVIVARAWQAGVPRRVVAKMLANIAVDGVVGSVPLVGDLFDFGWKANRKNLELLRRHGRKP